MSQKIMSLVRNKFDFVGFAANNCFDKYMQYT